MTRIPHREKHSPSILTVGHSTRSIEEFISLLRTHKVRQVVDVRTIPRSRHNPQFNSEALMQCLKEAGIGYLHMGNLGGLRHARPDSQNTAWRNASFRGYADYMQTPEFDEALEKLIHVAGKRRTAIMCAEAVPWRCHRSLIADALVAHDLEVEEIIGPGPSRSHALTPWARVEGGRVTYPGSDPEQL